jgi:hypothetical protein
VAAGPVPIKTPEGQVELSTRQRRLSQRHRTVLLLVDGRRTEAQVRALALQAGAQPSCFDELLGMALIRLQRPGGLGDTARAAPTADDALDLDLPLSAEFVAAAVPAPVGDDSVLPSAQSLQPESVLGDSLAGELPSAEAWRRLQAADDAGADRAVDEAREILVRAVRAEAPVAGSLTLLKLRRARSRGELLDLLDEVEAKILKPHRSLAATQTIRRARHVLSTGLDSSRQTV